MAELADGGYCIINASDTSLRMDVYGQGDDHGTNVQVWPANDSNAQFAQVVTNRDGSRTIFFPLTGKVLDCNGGTFTPGTNIATWEATGAPSNKFAFEATGRVAEYKGKSYPTWWIHPFADQTCVVDVEGDGRAVAGANLWLFPKADDTPEAQQWVFYPLATLPEGTYVVASALDTSNVWDVAGGSDADGANVQLWSEHGRACQCFKFVANGDGTHRIVSAQTGKAVSVGYLGRDPAHGDNVIQWAWNGSTGQRWYPEYVGWLVRNEANCVAYMLRTQFGESELFADACGALSQPGTNVWLWDGSGSVYGRTWQLRPDSVYAPEVAAPSSLALVGPDGAAGRLLAATSKVQVRPTWSCPAEAYQLRYRTRTRAPGMGASNRSAWSPWRSIRDGSAANDGWGGAWRADCAFTSDGSRRTASRGITCDLATYDRVDVEFEVRAFDPAWGPTSTPAHGASASGTFCVCRPSAPSVSGAVAWGPAGLVVPLASTLPRGGNRVGVRAWLRAGSGRRALTDGWVHESGQGQSCSVTVPTSRLALVPDDGAQLLVDVSWTTADGATTTASALPATCSWDAGHGGLSLSPSVTEVAGHALRVRLGAHERARLWVVTDGRVIECPESSEAGAYLVPYPFGRDYDLFAYARDSDTRWDTWHEARPASNPHAYAWLFDATDARTWFEIDAGGGAPPEMSWGDESAADVAQRAGGGYDVVRMGLARSQPVSVSGVLHEGLPEAEARLLALRGAGYAWFRDPFGHVARVAVSKASYARRDPCVAEVSVEMRRVDDPS